MLALLRPNSWDFPLFLHVLGSVVLFGGVLSITLLGVASLKQAAAPAAVLRRLAFATTLVVVWPSFVLMRIAGQWILNKEGLDENTPDWAGVGFFVSDIGVLVLATLTLLAWFAWRGTRPDRAQPPTARFFTVLAGVYVLALGVAWFFMSAKPGS